MPNVEVSSQQQVNVIGPLTQHTIRLTYDPTNKLSSQTVYEIDYYLAREQLKIASRQITTVGEIFVYQVTTYESVRLWSEDFIKVIEDRIIAISEGKLT